MALAHRERVVFDPAAAAATGLREHPVAIVHAPREQASPREQVSPTASRRLAQRADLQRLRRRLEAPCELKDRDLLTLLSYAVGGDGDPIIGLLDDARATIAMLGEIPAGTEPNVLASLERRLAVALELYSRTTASDDP